MARTWWYRQLTFVGDAEYQVKQAAAPSSSGSLRWRLGTPIAGWFISWKTLLKWMRTGGTPILGNLQISFFGRKGLKTHRKAEDLNEFCRETWGNMRILSATTGICVWYIRRKLPSKRCRTVNFCHRNVYLFWVITHLAIHLPTRPRLPGHARQSPVPSSSGSPSCILWVATSGWSTGAGVEYP